MKNLIEIWLSILIGAVGATCALLLIGIISIVLWSL